MNLEYICEFVTLTQTGRFQDAAEQLYISQPTLSKHIKKLEEDLGSPLLLRAKKRKLQLTEFGKLFLPYALQLNDTYQEFQRELKAHDSKSSHHVSIGVVPMAAPMFMMRYLHRYLEEHPEYSFDFYRDSTNELVKSLKEGSCDFIIIPNIDPSLTEGYRTLTYVNDRLVAILPKDHRLAEHESVSLAEIAREKIIFFRKSGVFRQIQKLCLKENIPIAESNNVAYPSEIIDMVKNNVGVSIMVNHAAEHYAKDDVAIVPISPEIPVEYILVMPDVENMSDLAQGLIDAISHRPRPQA